ncbi:MAG TPA: hypothetical protein VLA40_08105 [Rheinheimera sp.]|nr:hypothetical protein [Rheinheimera sp.]
MFQLNGNPISIDSEQVIGGIRYPHLRDPALREQLGVVEVADPEQYDQRFYWGVGNPKLLNDREEVDQDGNPMYVKVLGEVNGEPAMVDSTERLVTKGLKSQWTAQVKDTAGKMLAQTDWMVVRKAERNIDVPVAVATKRAAIVAECDRLEAAIAACTDVEALIAVVGAQNWPEGN